MWRIGEFTPLQLPIGRERTLTRPSVTLRIAHVQLFPMLGNDALQRVIDSIRVHIAEAERNRAGQSGPRGGDQFPESKVMGQQNTSLVAGFLQDIVIRQTLKTLVGEMDRIVSQGLQERSRLGRDAHVSQEFHRPAGSNGWTVSSASHAAYCRAWRTSSGSRYG